MKQTTTGIWRRAALTAALLALYASYALLAPAPAWAAAQPLVVTGEAYLGETLRDDAEATVDSFFDALGARAAWALGEGAAVSVRSALVGEPALGPVALGSPSRWSPLAFYLPGATPLAVGVATAGLSHGAWALEASLFNGQGVSAWLTGAPMGAPDACSGRLAWRPDARWALQVSHARLADPDTGALGVLERSSASVGHVGAIAGGTWSNTLIWGHGADPVVGQAYQSLGVSTQLEAAGGGLAVGADATAYAAGPQAAGAGTPMTVRLFLTLGAADR